MYEFSDETRIGAIYVSENRFDFSGDVSFKNLGVSLGTDTTSLAGASTAGGLAALDAIDSAMSALGNRRATFGAVMNRLTAARDVDYVCFAGGAHARTLEMHTPDRHGPPMPYMGFIKELQAAGCAGITNSLTVLFTASHPNLGAVTVNDIAAISMVCGAMCLPCTRSVL